MKNFDVLIINKGIAGLALACGLSDYFRVVVIEQNEYFSILKQNKYNTKISWINMASVKILQYLGVWDQNIVNFCTILYALEIINKGCFDNITFESGYLGYPALGYTADYRLIYHIFINQVKRKTNITFMHSVSIHEISYHNSEVNLVLNNGYTCTSKLIIGADGVDSWVRHHANIPLIFKDIEYYGLVTIIHSEKKYDNTVRYIVHNNDILVLLPSNDAHCFIGCWILPSHIIAKEYMYKSDYTTFINRNLITIINLLGSYVSYDEKNIEIFPLTLQYARNFIKHRLVLLGKSAYNTVCPLIFQDINLELMDAAILFHYLQQLKQDNKDIGYNFYLKFYERIKRNEIIKTNIANPYIYNMWMNNNYSFSYIYCTILWLTKVIPYFKQNILHYIMGLHHIPIWLLK